MHKVSYVKVGITIAHNHSLKSGAERNGSRGESLEKWEKKRRHAQNVNGKRERVGKSI